MNRYWQSICLACALALGLSSVQAQEDQWPRTLPVDEGLVTIYPLQVDAMEGDIVRYRAALAYRPTPDAEPVFGAGWFESKVAIDRKNRIVQPAGLQVTQTRFPDGSSDIRDAMGAALAAQSAGWNLDFSLDQLERDLQTAAAEQVSLQQLNTAPPQIVYRDHPALLVTLDGAPLLREIEDTPYRAVINTPYPLITDGSHYYLNVAKDVWYRADHASGPYRFDAGPPAGVAALVKPDEDATSADAPTEPVTASNAPEIVIATRPTELIVTEGPAVFVPLVEDLLVLQNSDDDVFMHVGSQQFYIVLAGRWYHAPSLDGPWSYRPADQLPPSFAEIPSNSGQADARVHVAGTEEAAQAALDAQVPQTAAVARGPADIDVSYDGEPDFRPVDGTDLEYAANSGATVLQSDRQYYLVEDGVWYVSDKPNGPWQVSAWRPQSVGRIAPTSPVYHVKYVYIYDSTPDVVYVGYTPGYFGSYVYRGTVVYGTGWYYRPWVSPYYYYPRPSTWGFHVSYNPWSGWGFGLSWNWGWGWGPSYANYWTGGYWHQPYPWYHGHYGYRRPHGYRPRPAPYGHHRGGHDRYAQPHRRADGNSHRGRQNNLYGDPGQRAHVADSRNVRQRAQPGRGGSESRGRNRHDPVTPADLRLKAQLRDADQSAVSGMMVADSSGKVSRKSKRQRQPQPLPQAAPARSARVTGQVRTRERPGRQTVQPGDRSNVSRQADNQPVIRQIRPTQDRRRVGQTATAPRAPAPPRRVATNPSPPPAAGKTVHRVQPVPARAPEQRTVRAAFSPDRRVAGTPKGAGRPDRGSARHSSGAGDRGSQKRH